MGFNIKKLILGTTFTLCTGFLFALDMPYFSGYAGIRADISGTGTGFDNFTPDVEAETFFAGQLDFNGNFILKGEFYLETDNLTQQNILLEPLTNNAKFRVQEFSATAKVSAAQHTNYFSLFLGNFDPIGSDSYLQKHFGIQSITSGVTESWHGMAGASVFPFYGAGLSYSLRFESPAVLGLNIYANKSVADYIMGIEPDNIVNIDARYACVYPYLTFDIMAGLGLPIETQTGAGEQVFVLIKSAQLHAGFNLLLGNRHTTSFFMQAGIDSLNLEPGKPIEINPYNIYFLMEPRFKTSHMNFNIALFNIPQAASTEMLYLRDCRATTDIFGINFTALCETLYLGNTNISLGIHATATINDPNFEQIIANPMMILAMNPDILITPYISMPVFGGNLNAHIRVNVLGFTTDPFGAIKASVGFKTSL